MKENQSVKRFNKYLDIINTKDKPPFSAEQESELVEIALRLKSTNFSQASRQRETLRTQMLDKFHAAKFDSIPGWKRLLPTAAVFMGVAAIILILGWILPIVTSYQTGTTLPEVFATEKIVPEEKVTEYDLIAMLGGTQRIGLFRISAGMPDPTPIVETPFTPFNTIFDVSSDGNWVVFFQVTSETSENSELFKIRTDGSERTQLTSTPQMEAWARWSPDGTQIAYVQGQESGTAQIWIMNADGSSPSPVTPVEMDAFGGLIAFEPDYSPDGKWLYFTGTLGPASEDASRSVYRIDPDGSQLMRISKGPGHEDSPLPSPDGVWVAYIQGDENREVKVWNSVSGETQSLASSPDQEIPKAWSQDGRYLAILAYEDRELRVGKDLLLWDAKSGKLGQISFAAGDRVITDFFAWSPEGSFALINLYNPETKLYEPGLLDIQSGNVEPVPGLSPRTTLLGVLFWDRIESEIEGEVQETREPSKDILAPKEVPSESTSAGDTPSALSTTSSDAEIRQHLSQSKNSWRTIWIDANVVHSQKNEIYTEHEQAWVGPNSSRWLSGMAGEKPSIMVLRDENSSVFYSFPGGKQHEFESSTGLPYYLEHMIFPEWFARRNGVFQPVRVETIAHRKALIVEWKSPEEILADRLWIETKTGFVLRWQILAPRLALPNNNQQFEIVEITWVQFDLSQPEPISSADINFDPKPKE